MNNILDRDSFREGPPRHLSILTRINVLFGGFSIQFGSIFFWFGMIFLLGFGGQSEAIHWFSFDGKWVESEGLLLEINDGNGSINEEPIYEYVFSYSVNGQSFTGKSNAVFNGEEENTIVPIEYKEGKPIRSRITGMRSEVFPGWIVFFVIIFPAIGFGFLYFGFKKNIKAVQLLKNGTFTRGKMISYEATGTSINDQTVYAYKFEFHANNKTYISECKTHLTDKVEDEETEKILYDKADPTFSLVYDSMEAAPKMDHFGKIKQSNILALRFLFSTILGLLINGLVFFSMYM